MPRIVKDAVIKLPKVTSSVDTVLRGADKTAKAQRWRKCIVIGEGPHGYHISNSKMKYYTVIGMLEYAKAQIINEADE